MSFGVGAGNVKFEGAAVVDGVDFELFESLVVVFAICRSDINNFPHERERDGLEDTKSDLEGDLVSE